MSGRRLRMPPVQYLLAAACLLSAIVLAASHFLTMFEFTPPGGEPLQSSDAADQHGFGLVVLAAFAIGALAIATVNGSKPAATAIAIAGGIAFLIFLLVDLPDAGKIGTLDDPRQAFIDAEAVPQAGFWFELLGSLSLTVSGIAFATLTPEQLALFPRDRAGRERSLERRAGARKPYDAEAGGAGVEAFHGLRGRDRPASATRPPRRRERG